MTDRKQFEAMLEALINEDQETAKELFHNIVVAKSREIYEELLESDFPPAKDEEEETDDDTEDSDIGGDATDDFASDVEDDGEDSGEDDTEMGDSDAEPEGDVEDRVQDLEDALEDLKAEFDQMLSGEKHEEETGEPGDHGGELDNLEPGADMGGDDMGMDDMGADQVEDESMGGSTKTIHHVHHNAEDTGMPYESIDSDEQLIREYVEKVGMNWDSANPGEGQHVGAQAGSVTGSTNTKSIVASKNDMGGTSANIVNGHREVSADVGAKSTVQGPGVMKPNVVPNPDAKGNINVPGGKAGKTGFKTQVKGGGIDRQAGFNKPGMQVGAKDTSGRGESNTTSILKARK
jgi:hypothetical protein